MREERWEPVIPGGTGYTSKVFHEWKSAVLKIRDMAEYRLRKLYSMGFTPEDIARDRHHSVFPPPGSRQKHVIGVDQDGKRGRRLSGKKKNWIYARALRDAAQGILAYYRLDSAMLADTRKELESFNALLKKFANRT